MLRIVTIAALLLLALPTAHANAAQPSLKPAVTVTGDLVHVGDLVEHAGALADIAIFRSPDLGTTGAVATARVREALLPYGLADLDTGGLAEVVVTRPSRTITVKEIEDRILRALVGQRGLGAIEDLKLNLDQSLRMIHVEADATAELRVSYLHVDSHRSRFGIVLDIPGSAILRRTPLRLTGRVVETAEATVLTRSLRRGDVIRRGDVAIERRPRVTVDRDDISRSEHAIGLAVRRPLRAGHVLRHADLMKPELVHRDEAVTLVYNVPGITLTIRGKAQEAGAEGDMVNVLNLQSKRIVKGTVVAAGQISVAGTFARIVPAKTAELQATSASNQSE